MVATLGRFAGVSYREPTPEQRLDACTLLLEHGPHSPESLSDALALACWHCCQMALTLTCAVKKTSSQILR